MKRMITIVGLAAIIAVCTSMLIVPRVRDAWTIHVAKTFGPKPIAEFPEALRHSVYEHNDPEHGYEIIEVGRCKTCGRFTKAGMTACERHD